MPSTSRDSLTERTQQLEIQIALKAALAYVESNKGTGQRTVLAHLEVAIRAADTIEAKDKELARLRSALEDIASEGERDKAENDDLNITETIEALEDIRRRLGRPPA